MVQKGKIILADYISYADKEGHPIGHPLKILNEYANWIEEDYNIIYAAHPIYLRKLGNNAFIKLSYNIEEGKDYSSLRGKIRQLIISWINIHKICKEKTADYIWFCNIDFFLIFYLLFHKRIWSKVIITTYITKFSNEYQQKMFYSILPKIRLIINSDVDFQYKGDNSVHIPDYLYDEGIYGKYRNVKKKNKVVCVGTMGTQKELLKLVDAFNRNKYLLEIVGHFSDEDLYNELKRRNRDNVIIRNCYLGYEEYMEKIAESKFCVLPYRQDIYTTKTSGVALECVFVDTIPICYQTLLQKWQIYGIGYNIVDELGDIEWNCLNINQILNNNRRLIHEMYDLRGYEKKLLNMLGVERKG